MTNYKKYNKNKKYIKKNKKLRIKKSSNFIHIIINNNSAEVPVCYKQQQPNPPSPISKTHKLKILTQ